MKYEVRSINYFNGCLQLPFPMREPAKISELQKACNSGKTLTVEVKVKRKIRSHNANSYCWALCTELARVLRTSKEEVYKQAIRSIGAATPTQILEAAVERYIQIWTGQGLGWVVENQGRCKDRPGYVMLACYHGSSVYNTKEMACLIDYLIEAAKDQGIDVMSEADKSLLLEEWGHEKK